MALLSRAIVRTLPAVPKPIVRRISERYIAGTRVEDACRVVKRLNAELGDGTVTVVEVLGPTAPSWKHGRLGTRDGRGPRDTYG